MWFGIDDRRVSDQVKVAMPRRQLDSQLALNELLTLSTIFNKRLDGAHLQAVLPAELAQLRHSGHSAISLQYLANDSRLLKCRQPRQVNAALSMAGSD